VPHEHVADRAVEPGRVLLNFHVASIQESAARMDELGAPWVAAVEYRDAGLWFGTVEDPDGNYVQLIEETPAYAVLKAQRADASLGE
jgi:predicted enzyme related to lactoylglutathione lyase